MKKSNNSNSERSNTRNSRKRYENFSSVPAEKGDTDGFNQLSQSIQQQRSEVTKTQSQVVEKWEQLDQKAESLLGTLTMRKADKEMLGRLDEARTEAAEIILSSRNESLSVVAETMVRYNKSLANTLVMTLETSNSVALDSHFMESKLQLMSKLESLNKRFVAMLHEKEEELEEASETIKPLLKDQGLALMSSWIDDYEKIIEEFSEIRERKFK